jgi:hypothetical protein
VTRDEKLELAGLCGLAWEQRGTDTFLAAVAEVVDWFDRRWIRSWERRQRRRAAVLQVLQETRP